MPSRRNNCFRIRYEFKAAEQSANGRASKPSIALI